MKANKKQKSQPIYSARESESKFSCVCIHNIDKKRKVKRQINRTKKHLFSGKTLNSKF